jgi:NAD(P)-dependent dehydrogenase (short-subunit alcohol dehydrogenase family)
MRVVAVTGSASGIGSAIRARLEKGGHKVIGVDLREAEVIADLAHPHGRRQAIAGVLEACGGRLEGLVACAGVGPQIESRPTIVSLNYFGARDLLAGLRDALTRGSDPAAVAISSNSSSLPGSDSPILAACLEGDEAKCRRLAADLDGQTCYASSKRALALWVRRNAPLPEWAGVGIRLNSVAPGAVMTPLLRDGLAHPLLGRAIEAFPIPLGGFGDPDQVAAAAVFLLGADARFFCGSVVFCDGGSDALLRPDAY